LRYDLALKSDSFASNAHPGVLEGLGSAGQQTGTGTGGMVVAVSIDYCTAAVAMFAASVWGDGQGQPQPPPQSYEHAVGRQSSASLARGGAEPGCSVRPRL